MKKLINILACVFIFLIVVGIQNQWNEPTMYTLFIIAIVLGLSSYFLNEPRVL